MKKIGIIGSGPVGHALATAFANRDYEVMIGSRDPEKLEKWISDEGPDVRAGTFSDTAKFGEIIVLAVKGTVAENALDIAGKENLKNKTIIDTTNPIADAPPEDGVISFFTDLNGSLMETLQNKFKEARFVKAFNSVGNSLMADPGFGSIKPTMFIAGDHKGSKEEVRDILDEFGWETEDMGSSKAARAIEPLCILWCIPGILENRWNHAFKLLKG